MEIIIFHSEIFFYRVEIFYFHAEKKIFHPEKNFLSLAENIFAPEKTLRDSELRMNFAIVFYLVRQSFLIFPQ